MKIMRLIASTVIILSLLVACNSSKKTTNNKSKKDPAAAEAAAKIGKMLDLLATDLIGASNQKAEIVRTADGINITFQPDFYFESSSEKLTVDAKGVLDDISSVLSQYPYTEIFIEGHADSSGNQLNNKKLSELRAKTVALYFKAHNVNADRIAIAGYGATRPVESNSTPEGRRRNRRVVVKINANEKKFLASQEAAKGTVVK
ncbi:OmpA/MotB domain protein [Emticicia oligotrophica DSM 17448]|uniref:OmpA/MotB domain protein n=2 Tax=Leadbetterellaceae TaxID=3141702 RepID=A0ABN4ASJ0_EMTOG|nr:OmpA/MotB domain protein [Emticicia oligotrophica DSM 17448]